MQVVYATGQPRLLEFAVTDQRKDMPYGATVFAVCDGDRVMINLDEDLFAAITDEEYYTYRALLREAIDQEKQRPLARAAATPARRFCNWLAGLAVGEDAAIHQSCG